MGLFVQLDVNWSDNHKVIAVGLDGAGLHATAMCMAKRMETDGVLHVAQLTRVGATPELIDRLVSVGLLDTVDEVRVRVHGWLDRNPDRVGIQQRSRAGNHKRWGHTGLVDQCPLCNPVDNTPPTVDNGTGPGTPRSSADSPNGIPEGSHADPPRESLSVLETETETETETEQQRNVPRARGPALETFTAAADLLAARRLLTHPTRSGNPERHRTSVRASILKDRATDAYALIAHDPDIDPHHLADLLEPPAPDPPAESPRTDPLAGQQTALIARAAEGTDQTKQLMAEPGNPTANLAAIANLRTTLTPHPPEAT